MFRRLAATALAAAAATTLIAAPAAAATSSAQLIRTKVSFGRCEDTCKIKVRIRNVSGKYLYNVRLNARLSIDGRSAGTCYDYVGTIRPYRVRYAACTVRTARLADLYNAALDGRIEGRPYARTNVSYKYYR
ncbi:hypothetical protein MF672_001460 [Actinomadura sp. ATCC 31491]|uniref:Spore-associated protein A n=1 Tax=Actinomadura luzonensis TaxID=2805427 RepID=A0ABT0FJH7_9ACTN|nr:hypothetical protein [Actinomadura luzonensis]MCK2212472.1 hypothetical protein [Actinomadura luzonensis]